MNLERITVEFHAEEDRLMVRVFFDKKAEIQFWLTRRLVKRVWPVLLQMAQARPDIQMQPNPEVRKALLGMQHEKALQEVKFSKAAQEPEREHRWVTRQCWLAKCGHEEMRKARLCFHCSPS